MRFSVFALAGAAALAAFGAHAAEYAIDPHHTYATFAIDHNGASINRGRFDKVTGTIEFDLAARTGKVDVKVDTSAVSAGSQQFNDHLRSPDLFNVAKFPDMRFVSEQFVFDESGKLVEVLGQMTLLGVTQPLVLKANQFTCYENRMAKAEACGGDFEATIDRTLWGMNYAAKEMGNAQVRIGVTIEAFKKPAAQ
ncbi:MAG: polyisoprenoid-binding protein [Ottowia sp.]|nr:polyisoprenoid-binding protein [Ottowia sp.]